MASAELRLIRRRIRSVQSTMKITRAMELIATSRIAKAHVRVAQSQPYTNKMVDVIRNIAAAGGLQHPLLETRQVDTIGVLIVTSDRGLAGGYNSNIMRLAERAIAGHHKAGLATKLYVVGQKANGFFRYRNHQIEQAFLGVTDRPTYNDARAIASVLLNGYQEVAVDAVEAYTTRFQSAFTQVPVHWPLLPIEPPAIEDAGATVGYSFEPSPEEILGRLLPRYLEATVFGMLLEASASEHAARRRAMKAATENAEELTRTLTREANQARQAEITTEISEIVGGAEALSGG